MEITGIGIVGCGIWGAIHAQTFSSSPIPTQIVSVCDQDKDRAEQFSRKYDAKGFTTNYKEILSIPKISAVSIATPDHTHTQIVLDAPKQGNMYWLKNLWPLPSKNVKKFWPQEWFR